jgi:hypothetical protein
MKSLKRFKDRIVSDKNLSCRVTDCSYDTVKKISEITSSAYKLDAKPTGRSVLKKDHSLERKSPLKIPAKYLKSHRQLTFRDAEKSRRQFNEEEIFKNVKSIP